MNNAEVRQRLALEHGVDLEEIDTEYHSEPRFLGMARLQPKAMHSSLIELDAKAKLQKEYWLLEGVPSDALCRLQVVKIVAFHLITLSMSRTMACAEWGFMYISQQCNTRARCS